MQHIQNLNREMFREHYTVVVLMSNLLGSFDRQYVL